MPNVRSSRQQTSAAIGMRKEVLNMGKDCDATCICDMDHGNRHLEPDAA